MGADPRFSDNFDDYSFEEQGKPPTKPMSIDQIDAEEPSALKDYLSTLDREIPHNTIAREPLADEERTSNIGERTGLPSYDTGFAVGGRSGRAAGDIVSSTRTPVRQQTLAEAMDEVAPLDGTRTFAEESQQPDTIDNAKDPWEWMTRKGYVAPEGVDLKSRAAASRKDVERAQLGLAKDWINSPEGAREMQSRKAGMDTPTHVWDKPEYGATVQQRYAPQPGQYFRDADQLYADQANSMSRYGIPQRPGSVAYSPMAKGEFAARVAAGEDPQEIIYQERRAAQKAALDARRERAFKADFIQHRKTPLVRPFWTWGTSDEEAAQKAWEDDQARRGL